MANRHLARSVVLQTLYEWDFRETTVEDALTIFERNAKEFAPGLNDHAFMRSLVEHVIKKCRDLDTIISKAAPDWPIDKISIIDRNILRLGLAELLFADTSEVPPKVAINESIELAKSFGGETSGKFVNGVLGAVYKEMGEPGKDDVAPKKKHIEDIPDEKAPIKNLVGAIVYALHEGEIYLALVHDVFGHWTLSKGHVQEGETLSDGIIRVVQEEMSLPVEPEQEIGNNEYIAFDPEKGKLRKRVTYMIAKAPYVEVVLKSEGGLDAAQWFPIAEIADLNFYGDVLPIVTKAVSVLLQKHAT